MRHVFSLATILILYSHDRYFAELKFCTVFSAILFFPCKMIETRGVKISEGKVVKGRLAFISGDNLGNHSLRGFQENFSTTEFFFVDIV